MSQPFNQPTSALEVFVRKGEVPPLTQVSVADFKEGGYFEAHDHEDMFENLRFAVFVGSCFNFNVIICYINIIIYTIY